MHPWVTAVKRSLEPLADPNNAKQMAAYMRNQFPFFGIQSGPRRAAVKPLFAKAQLPQVNELADIIEELWNLPQREFQLIAVDLLIKLKKQLPISFAEHLERCIINKSWWDTVDLMATHIAGKLYLNYPDDFPAYLDRWARSDNLWLKRTTILYQLKYKELTEFNRLAEFIKYNQSDTDFFMQKAIGWALREYSKTRPKIVVDFINQQQIEGLAKREALKWLKSK